MDDLEREALTLWRQHGWLLKMPMGAQYKGFLRKLAERLGWSTLLREMG